MTEQLPNNPSSGPGATPAPGSPATGNPASLGATPTVKPPATLEEALAELAELRRHATNKEEQATRHGKDLTAAQKELAAYKEKERLAQEATLSEIDKAKKQALEIQQKYEQTQKQLVAAHVKIAAQKLGIVDPTIAALAIADKLEFGEDGLPTNADKLLDELVKGGGIVVNKPAEPQTTPAQRPPATPANNPGRQNIVQPGQQPLPRSQWPKLGDVLK